MRYWPFYFLLIFLLSCKGEFASTEVKQSYESVMFVHDEVMPEMSTINKLRRQIKKLPNQNAETTDLIQKLEAADDSMMDWMQTFNLDRKSEIHNQLEYLDSEQEKINKVSKDMKESIAAAKAYLNNI